MTDTEKERERCAKLVETLIGRGQTCTCQRCMATRGVVSMIRSGAEIPKPKLSMPPQTMKAMQEAISKLPPIGAPLV